MKSKILNPKCLTMVEIDSRVKADLTNVVGDKCVITDQELRKTYERDQSFVPACLPDVVVLPENSVQVLETVKIANKHRIPIVPKSSAVSLHGGSIPSRGGILLDLKRMNQIVELDEKNWYVIIEPGVTFLQLRDYLKPYGFYVAGSFLNPPSASVVSSYMERTPVTTAADFTYGTDQVISYTIASPSGETFTVGHPPLENAPAGASDGPGLNFYRVFQGAQGTLGVVTRMIIRVLPIPGARKLFFFPGERLDESVNIIRQIQAKELGLECFALNRFNLAALLVEEADDETDLLKKGETIGNRGARPWSVAQNQRFNELRKTLPEWTVIVCLSAVGPIPEEKIVYQELDIRDVAAEIGVEPKTELEGAQNLDQIIMEELYLPWRSQKRFGYRGRCHQAMFYARPDRIEDISAAVSNVVKEFDYPDAEMGGYVLPIERARGFYFSFDLFSGNDDQEKTARIADCFDAVSKSLMEKGAFFDRPYGNWAEMIYSRSGTYAEYLKKLKDSLDPNKIMNPGKLCF